MQGKIVEREKLQDESHPMMQEIGLKYAEATPEERT
jgi:hypothetical protein